MKILGLVLMLGAGLLLAGCGERVANVAKPLHYEKLGLSFLYPSNWMIDDDQLLEGVHHISLATSGTALVVVHLFPLGVARSLEEYARDFSKETAAAVPMGRMTASKFTPQPDADGYKCWKETCTMELAGKSIPHVRLFRSRDLGLQRCFLICQVPEEDLADVEEGFKELAGSLKMTLPDGKPVP